MATYFGGSLSFYELTITFTPDELPDELDLRAAVELPYS